MLKINNKGSTQPAFTCSKLTMETLEQARKMFKINNKDSGLFSLQLSRIKGHLPRVQTKRSERTGSIYFSKMQVEGNTYS